MNTPKCNCFKPTFCKSKVVSIFSYQNEHPRHGPQSPVSSSLLSLSSERSEHTGAPRYPSHGPQSPLSPSLLSLKSWRSEHTGAPWYPVTVPKAHSSLWSHGGLNTQELHDNQSQSPKPTLHSEVMAVWTHGSSMIPSHSPQSPLFTLKSWRSEHTGTPWYPVTVPKAHSSLWSHGGLNTRELHDTQSQSPKPTLHSEVMAVWTHRNSVIPSHSPQSPLFTLKSWRSEHTGAPWYPVTVPKAHSSLWSHGGLNTRELHDTQSQSPKPTLHSEVMAVWTHRNSMIPSHSPQSPLFTLKSWRSEHTGAPWYLFWQHFQIQEILQGVRFLQEGHDDVAHLRVVHNGCQADGASWGHSKDHQDCCLTLQNSHTLQKTLSLQID